MPNSHLKKIIILSLYIIIFTKQLSADDAIVILKGHAISQQMPQCNYQMLIGIDDAIISIQCKEAKFTYNCQVQEVHEDEKYDTHIFKLISQKEEMVGNLSCLSVRGVQWELKIEFWVDEEMKFKIDNKQLVNQYSICFIFGVYTLTAMLSLPPGSIFYKNMEGMGIYSLIVSVHLSLVLMVNLLITTYKYIRFFSFSFKGFLSISILIITFLCISMHIFYKCKNLLDLTFKNRNIRNALILFALCFGICIMAIPLYCKIHKNIFIYAYFASGLIFYMCSFIVFKKMKRYFFSFRLVLCDSFTILFLGISSSIYPIMFYQIPNFFHIVGLVLIFAVLTLNAGIAHILVNVIRKQIKQRKMERKKKKLKDSLNKTDTTFVSNQNSKKQMEKEQIDQKIQSQIGMSLQDEIQTPNSEIMINLKMKQ